MHIATEPPAATIDLSYPVHLLGDPLAGREEKLAALHELLAAGKAAMPALIARVVDPRDAIFVDEFLVETGPMNAGPPQLACVTARFVAERLLYRLIAPVAEPQPLALAARAASTGIDATRPAGLFSIVPERPPIAWVRDWPSFWKSHQHESLAEMRSWSARVVDDVWSKVALGVVEQPRELARASFAHTANFASSSEPQRSLMAEWRDPDLTFSRKNYARARQIYLAATRDQAKRSAARVSLQAIAAGDARLLVHVKHWLSLLQGS